MLRLVVEQDYPWLTGLKSLSLRWYSWNAAQAWAAGTPAQIITALTRLPALDALALLCPQFDELFVRLLVHAENGGASALPTLTLLSPRSGSWGYLSVGAHLLLLLWLKREAKKAVQGQGPGVKWELQGLDTNKLYMKRVTKKCIAQVKAAWRVCDGAVER
jgi:hypothetical protein